MHDPDYIIYKAKIKQGAVVETRYFAIDMSQDNYTYPENVLAGINRSLEKNEVCSEIEKMSHPVFYLDHDSIFPQD
jgi:hypothetical protein